MEATDRLPCQLGWLSAEKEEGLFTFVNLDLSFDFVSETDNYPNHKRLLSLESNSRKMCRDPAAHALLNEGEEHACPTRRLSLLCEG